MIHIRQAHDRGHANHGWLNSHHSFSFANYFDPEQMGWGPLRVINDDRVAPGAGFGTHPHRNMEILSYVLEGALEHRDTLGNGSVIRPGDVQLMTAGTGIAHSEFNHSSTEQVHFLQIWIIPDRQGLTPGYQQRHYDAPSRRGRLRLIAAPDREDGSLIIHQDARVYAALLHGNETISHALNPERKAYLHVARGSLTVNDLDLQAGDGLRIVNEPKLRLERGNNAEVLLFDLPNVGP